MKITDGVEMLEMSMSVMGSTQIVHPTLIWDNNNVILVDAGYPGQQPQIREEMEKAGLVFESLKKVIVTHHDMDHIGSLSSIKKELSETIEIISSEEERPFIQGDKRPTKITQLEAQIDSLSPEMRMMYESLKAGYEKYKTCVDKTVRDGEELPYCGGITVVYTPGHTPGHISLYINKSKTLIAGDILMVEGGRLVPVPQAINFDNELCTKSLEKLTQFDIASVICYHGGVYENDVNSSIAELAGK